MQSQIASWYEVDADNRICAVSPDWDEIVRSIGAARGLLGGSLIGQPLGRYISGDATIMFIETALQAARLTQAPRRLPYRCDTPWIERELDMLLLPLPSGAVRLEHALRHQQPRTRPLHFHTLAETQPLPDRPQRSTLRCSICLWVQRPSQPWVPPHTVHGGPINVRYTVCPRCRAEDQMARQLAARAGCSAMAEDRDAA